MEFYHLRSFVVVAETENLTKAAKRLCTTPPAISSHIKALEQELETPLFIRSSKGMKLTEKGTLLLEKAQKTLDSAIDMVNLAADNQKALLGDFTLTINQDVEHLKIHTLIENLQKHSPGISLKLKHDSSGKIIKQLESAEIDGGYIYGEIPSNLFSIKIKEVEITTIAPITFNNKINIDEDFTNTPWITMSDYCPFDRFLKNKLGPNIVSIVQSDNDKSRAELVEMGLGLSFLELQEAKRLLTEGKVKIYSQLNFSAALFFVVRKDKLNDPITMLILQEIRALWGITL